MTTNLTASAKAEITNEGHRQTVVLPESVHLADEEVYAVQIGTSVLLYSKPRTWEEWWKNLELFTDDFMADGRQQSTEQQQRDFYFDE